MKKSVKDRLYSFLATGTKEKSDSKDLAVLLRLLSILFAVYFLLMAIITAYLHYYTLSLILVLALGLLAGSFICTYENKTEAALILMNLTIVAMCSWLTLQSGFHVNFHWLITITILINFYSLKNTIVSKIYYSAAVCLWLFFITYLSIAHPVLKDISNVLFYIIYVLNMLVFIISIVTSAYFYREKFLDSEQKLISYNKKLIQMTATDALTQLPNRHSINEYMQDLAFTYSRTGSGFCIAIGDVDFFKRINDNYGHDVGDYVLTTLAGISRKFIENKGKVGRWGGDEFLFVLEYGNADMAFAELEKLRRQIAVYPFHYKDYSFNIAMTFGLEAYDERLGIETVIAKADSKLYKGKECGRNVVMN